ncbi:MAG TPA: bifunctional 23S rRNA (guanine(2069)-N(7))-methyltransferase RlmK/23S rRNA (guanine(2445)-N(2))-methyltransferase RlmL [Wenzhouxiangellaceae bacterium]|nr:bifunctional 23S rRNA (guanine(2069)-N(7))-methyltransferase RlmK/23S rRNA (guanine(2445)-N(2))-methyltransferase RlmL [Wenzhouxiangellaceae bacterium]
MSESHAMFATAPRGLEELLADELAGLGLAEVRVRRGGAEFESTLAGAYRACLWSRVANRILLPLAEFEAENDDGLYAGVRTVDWAEHLGPENTLAVDFTGIKASITHSRFAEQRVKDAVVDQLREITGERPSVDTTAPDVRINVHMHASQVTVALDLSGDSLHRRGYRAPGTAAPIKENLAAAILLRGDWPRLATDGGGFCDPMCGSGTVAIEAAWIAGDSAPGLLRTRFGFQRWRAHDDAAWKELVDEALERQEAGLAGIPPIVAFDNDPAEIRLALQNVQKAGLAKHVHVERRELGEARPPKDRPSGLVAVNPPYGERLAEQHELLPLYLRLGETLRRHFAGWRAMVLNGSGCQIGLKPERTWQMDNGPIQCRLERFELSSDPVQADRRPAEDLVNRVRKNRKQLGKWLKRNDIGCYRVYDADIPEYALAVDVYGTDGGDWLHVQEYEPPPTVDARQAQSRLRAALTALPDALDIPHDRMVFKVRRRQRGREQYERQAEQGRFLVVREGHCKLLVNLTDYLDTGLFLDHRTVRLWLAESSAGQSMLNLFSYTGAATVHAAVGGARSTTSVDLSRTYLDWFKRNLELNGLADGPHRAIRADVAEWLSQCRERFDLIFLDPPSFSNSKKMDSALDIQRDHAELIRQAMRCLAADGVLVFSTNLRRFRLDDDLADEFGIEDRSAWSIPKDFERNRKIHQCWFLRHRTANREDAGND